jgi:small subunit ribosomal protein S2
MATIPSVEELLKAGVHFGHRAHHWHPKMRSFIFGERKGIHVVDLEKTQVQLTKIAAVVTDIFAKGGNVLFVGTKPQAQAAVATAAQACGMPYINVRWLGGTLTNWPQIQRLLRHYLDLKDKREKGELRKYTKLEQLNFDREIAELDEKIGGLSSMKRLPDAVVVIDARAEKTAVREANSVHIPVIALVDTNVNPEGVTYVIPGNDDATSSITCVLNVLVEAIEEGKKKVVVATEAAKQAAAPKSAE